MNKQLIIESLNFVVNEGKVWDKVKKVWRDHKGKIIAGAGIAAAVAGGLAYKHNQQSSSPAAQEPGTHKLKMGGGRVGTEEENRADDKREIEREVKKKMQIQDGGNLAYDNCGNGKRALIRQGKFIKCLD